VFPLSSVSMHLFLVCFLPASYSHSGLFILVLVRITIIVITMIICYDIISTSVLLMINMINLTISGLFAV
jgi:hypothetical protein